MSKKTADSDIKVEVICIVYFILAFTLVIMFIDIIFELISFKYLLIDIWFLPALRDIYVLSSLTLF